MRLKFQSDAIVRVLRPGPEWCYRGCSCGRPAAPCRYMTAAMVGRCTLRAELLFLHETNFSKDPRAFEVTVELSRIEKKAKMRDLEMRNGIKLEVNKHGMVRSLWSLSQSV